MELSWGALMVVGFSDYVIRPRMVGDEAMPTYWCSSRCSAVWKRLACQG